MNKEETFKKRKHDIVYNGKIYVRADECMRLMQLYADEQSREAFKSGYGAGILHDEDNPNVHAQEKRAWEIFNQNKER